MRLLIPEKLIGAVQNTPVSTWLYPAKDSHKPDTTVSLTGTSLCTYAVEPPCTERYARWCERSGLIQPLLLDFTFCSFPSSNGVLIQTYFRAITVCCSTKEKREFAFLRNRIIRTVKGADSMKSPIIHSVFCQVSLHGKNRCHTENFILKVNCQTKCNS